MKKPTAILCVLALVIFFSISVFAARDTKSSTKAQAKPTKTVQAEQDATVNTSQPTAVPDQSVPTPQPTAAAGNTESKASKKAHQATDKTESSEYSEELTAAENTALADVGIAREDAKYIKSYMRYSEHDVISGVHVEIGVYDKAISPKTVVHIYEMDLDGEITERDVH